MPSHSERLAQAFEDVLGRDLEKTILIILRQAKRPVRYEELRKAAGETSPETFKRAIERLARSATVARKLEPAGARYQSSLSPTPRGMIIADTLLGLGRNGKFPSGLPPRVAADLRAVFLGRFP